MRGKIIDVLNEVIPLVVDTALKVNETYNTKTVVDHEVSISFGEYATPSFDSVVETVGKAKSLGIMSIEKAIDELYGDSMTDDEKIAEVKLIKEQNGMYEAEEPKVPDDAGDYESDLDEQEND